MKKNLKEKDRKRVGLFCLFLSVGLLAAFLPSSWAAEDQYPSRPVTIVVAYTPGGPMDLHSQFFGERLSKMLGQPFVRDYKPGGGGSLAASLVARAKPDGYSIYPGTTSSLVLAPIVKKLDYKLEDFASIGTFARTGVIFVVMAKSKWKTLKDFVESAKEQPGKLQVSSYGKLTAADFAIELLNKHAGIKLTHVPYKSTAEAMTALLGGHVDGAFVSSTGGQLESGTVRILGVADDQRSSSIPDVKTFKEEGFPVSMPSYYGFHVPVKTPQKVVDKLSNGMREIFKKDGDEVKEFLKRMEYTAYYQNPQESMKAFKEEYKRIFEAATELGLAAK
jgi:tripartite-type tricarboxylate transporter receptor subunit TctC